MYKIFFRIFLLIKSKTKSEVMIISILPLPLKSIKHYAMENILKEDV